MWAQGLGGASGLATQGFLLEGPPTIQNPDRRARGTMFDLYVRSMGGACQTMRLGPPISDLRARLERGAGDFHEVRLVHGTTELVDDAVVPVEVQAVLMKSPARALKE